MGRSEHLAAAKKSLADLKKEPTKTRDWVEQMRRHALEGGFCLCDLSISTEELGDIMKEVAKIRALKFLRELREEGRDMADFVPMIRESVAEAGCSLAEVGTSEEELTSFEGSVSGSLFE